MAPAVWVAATLSRRIRPLTASAWGRMSANGAASDRVGPDSPHPAPIAALAVGVIASVAVSVTSRTTNRMFSIVGQAEAIPS